MKLNRYEKTEEDERVGVNQRRRRFDGRQWLMESLWEEFLLWIFWGFRVLCDEQLAEVWKEGKG